MSTRRRNQYCPTQQQLNTVDRCGRSLSVVHLNDKNGSDWLANDTKLMVQMGSDYAECRSKPTNIPLNTKCAFRAKKRNLPTLAMTSMQAGYCPKNGLDPSQPQQTHELSGAKVLMSTNSSFCKRKNFPCGSTFLFLQFIIELFLYIFNLPLLWTTCLKLK